MRWIRWAFKFYLDASIHVSLALLSLVLLTYEYMDSTINWELCLFLFLVSVMGYNFIKYGVEAEKYVLVSNRYHRIIQIFNYALVIPAIYLGTSLSVTILVGIAVMSLFAALYAIPVLPNNHSFRTWGNAKIAIVALVWAGISVGIPLLDTPLRFSFDFWIELTQRFLFVIALMIPFEIRDLNFDKPELGTLPQKLGILRSKQLGYLLLCLAIILTFFKDYIAPGEEMEKTIVFLGLMAMIWFSKKERNPIFTKFWVEAIPIAWVIIALLI